MWIFIARQLDIDIAIPSVRPSVCLSVTFRYSIETTQCIIIVSPPHDSPILFMNIKHLSEFQTGALNTRAVYKYFAIFDYRSLYLANDTK